MKNNRAAVLEDWNFPNPEPNDLMCVCLFVCKAAIGSKALDMAREEGDEALVKFGLDVLTLAVLAILITAPIGALGIGLAGPRLLAQQVKGQHASIYTFFVCHFIF